MSLLMTRVLSTNSSPLLHLRNFSLSTPSSLIVERCKSISKERRCRSLLLPLFRWRNKTFRVKSFSSRDEEKSELSTSEDIQNGHDNGANDMLGAQRIDSKRSESSFLAKLAIALGVAATVTIICARFYSPFQGPSLGLPILFHGSSASTSSVQPGGFSLKVFGHQIIVPAYAPGWIYFWLLMAAGCGLFVSEEALNIWVGISLARLLSLDGTWASFAESFSRNASYIISTVLWVYWGVCISDMVPFYFGKLFGQTRISDDLCAKLGIDKKKAVNITSAVQKYGNVIGFVERFSIGVRNPTAFLAGSLGIPAECFFVGVCCGGLITLPIQLVIGFFLRKRPVVALASVATLVGIWTVFPYAMAASTALILFLRQRYSI
ncbi:Snare associated golgi protein [Thalictrum thalictroides]|uniref:Snare associated golgi protein n=1 Tax=Thalictrum thalictroides TaxID=46969 RepID=A0A7J6WVL3_THATH|nr:Snare associated golgi protein [Thalictrum thalictroides]